MNVLLVEPSFPIAPKSKNHGNFLPIGLLKIASYLRSDGAKIKLTRGYPKEDLISYTDLTDFKPDEIWITSLFTYWSRYVRDAVLYYKDLFPTTRVVVGGIYASLMPEHCKEYTGCDEVQRGVIREAENHIPAYDLIENANPKPIDYQIIHASRGCMRDCPFCGVQKIEPRFEPKKSIKDEIRSRKIVFYDNNFLYNPYVENILEELAALKRAKKIDWCESQSGFDGRILMERPYLAKKIKEAGFRQPRIAWDWGYDQSEFIEGQLALLTSAGYRSKDIYMFMLYNWDIPFEEMEKKRIKCWEWKTQIADCRYRPLQQTYDNYDPRAKSQTSIEYYIHEAAGWSDALVRLLRKNIRRQNICVRQETPFYSREFETRTVGKDVMRETKSLSTVREKREYLDQLGIDYWLPGAGQ